MDEHSLWAKSKSIDLYCPMHKDNEFWRMLNCPLLRFAEKISLRRKKIAISNFDLLKCLSKWYLVQTTAVTALRWPTKSSLVDHLLPRSITWAVGAPLFNAWAEMSNWPSGDQFNLKICVVPVQFLNGSSMHFSKLQSSVFHTFNVLSSDLIN